MSSTRSRSFLLLALVLMTASTAAQRRKLSHPLPATGDVLGYVVSRDGEHAVYCARDSETSPLHLYGVELRGGSVKLLDSGSTSNRPAAGAGGRVAYATAETFARLRSTPVDGSAPPTSLAVARSLLLSPRGDWVVYRDPLTGLWSVPIDGSSEPGAIQAGAAVLPLPRFTPDGDHVLFVQNAGDLYAARIDRATPPVRLNGMGSACEAGDHVASPDSKWVVFRGRSAGLSKKLFRVPLAGGMPPIQLDPVVPEGWYQGFHALAEPRFDPHSQRITYLIDRDVDDERQLFSVPIDGSSPPIELNGPLPEGGEVVMHRVTLAGTDVVYLASQEDPERYELYVVPLLGGTPRRLSRPGEAVHWSVFALSPDGRHVAYRGDPEGDGVHHLFLAPLAPGLPVIPLSEPVPGLAADPPSLFEFDSSGRNLVYLSLASAEGWPSYRGYIVPASGAEPPTRFDGPAVPGGGVFITDLVDPSEHYWVRFALGDTQALFLGDLERDDVFELWSTPVEKRGRPTRRR